MCVCDFALFCSQILASVIVVMEAVLKTVTTVLEVTVAHATLDMRKVAFMDAMVKIYFMCC